MTSRDASPELREARQDRHSPDAFYGETGDSGSLAVVALSDRHPAVHRSRPVTVGASAARRRDLLQSRWRDRVTVQESKLVTITTFGDAREAVAAASGIAAIGSFTLAQVTHDETCPALASGELAACNCTELQLTMERTR
jgi:hypothetical protein